MTTRRKVLLGGAAALVGATSVASLGRRARAAAAPIKIGITARLPQAPIYIAAEKGYYKEQGLNVDVELSNTASGGTTIPLLARGDLTMIFGGPSAAMFNAMNEGLEFLLAADGGQANPKFDGFSHALIVRKDLADKIKTFADLKGRIVCFGVRGGTFDYMGIKMLEQAGLKRSDLDIRYIPSVPDVVVALANKAIEASIITTPFNVVAAKQGIAVPFKDVRDMAPGMQNNILMLNEDFAKKRRDEAAGVIRAYIKAARWYNDQIKGDAKELIQIVSKWTKLSADEIHDTSWSYYDANGQMNVADLREQYNTWVKEGLSKPGLNLDKFLDDDLRKQALSKL